MSIFVPPINTDGLSENEASKLYQRKAPNYVRFNPSPSGTSLIKYVNANIGEDVLEEKSGNKVMFFNTSDRNISYGDMTFPSVTSFPNTFIYPSLNSNLTNQFGTLTTTTQPFSKFFRPNTFGEEIMGFFTRSTNNLVLQPAIFQIRINTRDLTNPLQTLIRVELGHCNNLNTDQITILRSANTSLSSYQSPSLTTQYYADFQLTLPQTILNSVNRLFFVKILFIFNNLPSSGSITTGIDTDTTNLYYTQIEQTFLYSRPTNIFSAFLGTNSNQNAGSNRRIPFNSIETSNPLFTLTTIGTNAGDILCNFTGNIQINACVNLTVPPTGNYLIAVYKNGLEVKRGNQFNDISSMVLLALNVSTIIAVNMGDIISIQILNSQNSTINGVQSQTYVNILII